MRASASAGIELEDLVDEDEVHGRERAAAASARRASARRATMQRRRGEQRQALARPHREQDERATEAAAGAGDLAALIAQPASHRPELDPDFARPQRAIGGPALVAVGDPEAAGERQYGDRRKALAGEHRSAIGGDAVAGVRHRQQIDDARDRYAARRQGGACRVETGDEVGRAARFRAKN